MAKKLYVGRASSSVVPYLDNTTTETLVNTGIAYGPGVGFKFDFVYSNSLTTSGYKHILNAGGIRTSTKLCLSVYNGKLSFEACLSSSGKSAILQNVAISQGTRYLVTWYIDTTLNKATYTVTDYETGSTVATTTKNITNLDYTFSGANICIYNQENWDKNTSSTTRAAYIKFYSMVIFSNNNVVADLMPDPAGTVGEESYIYDYVKRAKLNYKYSDRKAVYYEEAAGALPAAEAKKLYVGVNGVPKLALKAYVGVNGTPKLFYEDSSS